MTSAAMCMKHVLYVVSLLLLAESLAQSRRYASRPRYRFSYSTRTKPYRSVVSRRNVVYSNERRTKTYERSRLTGPNICGSSCCNGWKRTSSGYCTVPVCLPKCHNRGICIKPGKCKCQVGFSGNRCSLRIQRHKSHLMMVVRRKRQPSIPPTIIQTHYTRRISVPPTRVTSRRRFIGRQDLCAGVTCYNGGVCISGECVCSASYTGSRCQYRKTRPSYSSVPTRVRTSSSFSLRVCRILCEHGTCTSMRCICDQHYSGNYCTTRTTYIQPSTLPVKPSYRVRPISIYPASSSNKIPLASTYVANHPRVVGKCYKEFVGIKCQLSFSSVMTASECCGGLGEAWGPACTSCTLITGSRLPRIECPRGYETVDGLCEDINECLRFPSSLCRHGTCHNSLGSFWCLCNSGYRQGETNTKCIRKTAKVTLVPDFAACYVAVSSGGRCDSQPTIHGSKAACCCSVGAAWGPGCDACPVVGTRAHKRLCPFGSGYFKVPSADVTTPPVESNFATRNVNVSQSRTENSTIASSAHQDEETTTAYTTPYGPVSTIKIVESTYVESTREELLTVLNPIETVTSNMRSLVSNVTQDTSLSNTTTPTMESAVSDTPKAINDQDLAIQRPKHDTVSYPTQIPTQTAPFKPQNGETNVPIVLKPVERQPVTTKPFESASVAAVTIFKTTDEPLQELDIALTSHDVTLKSGGKPQNSNRITAEVRPTALPSGSLASAVGVNQPTSSTKSSHAGENIHNTVVSISNEEQVLLAKTSNKEPKVVDSIPDQSESTANSMKPTVPVLDSSSYQTYHQNGNPTYEETTDPPFTSHIDNVVATRPETARTFTSELAAAKYIQQLNDLESSAGKRTSVSSTSKPVAKHANTEMPATSHTTAAIGGNEKIKGTSPVKPTAISATPKPSGTMQSMEDPTTNGRTVAETTKISEATTSVLTTTYPRTTETNLISTTQDTTAQDGQVLAGLSDLDLDASFIEKFDDDQDGDDGDALDYWDALYAHVPEPEYARVGDIGLPQQGMSPDNFGALAGRQQSDVIHEAVTEPTSHGTKVISDFVTPQSSSDNSNDDSEMNEYIENDSIENYDYGVEMGACIPSPCINDGVCTLTPDGEFLCDCLTGFRGELCEEVDWCASQPCENRGLCENTEQSYHCNCLPGFTGATCQTVSDICESLSCVHGKCQEYAGDISCLCEPGYTGVNCDADVDECEVNKFACDRSSPCVNTMGSFRCLIDLQCDQGYAPNADGTICEDVDECAGNTSRCDGGSCTNSRGSYFCTCSLGYVVAEDGSACNDLDECETVRCGEASECHNVPGTYRCDCPISGQYYDYVSQRCVVTATSDEGEEEPHERQEEERIAEVRRSCYADDRTCSVELSSNVTERECCCTFGRAWGDCNSCPFIRTASFRLLCPHGHGLIPALDSFNVQDVDECAVFGNSVACPNGRCHNSYGAFECQCYRGFYYNRRIHACQDFNECTLPYKCVDGTCINTVGSFHCKCPPGSLPRFVSLGIACFKAGSVALSTRTPTVALPTITTTTPPPTTTHRQRVATLNLQPCYTELSANSICDNSYNRNSTYQDCCCADGDSWGYSCSKCPTRQSNDFNFLCRPQSQNPNRAQVDSYASDQACGIEGGCINGACIRLNTGFTCKCNRGYRLNAHTMKCDDINECLEHNARFQLCIGGRCVNTQGSFRCNCRHGYIPSPRNPSICVSADQDYVNDRPGF